MPRDFDGSVSEYEGLLSEQAQKIKVSVLLLGPCTRSRRPAAILRKYIATNIATRCEGGRNAIYGERKDLIKVFQKRIGEFADLCLYELHLATKVVDAIIIIPDSAGSLVELGMFSLKYDIHRCTLVLFSNKHNPQNEDDFISLGPKRSYNFVKTVDYRDKEIVWNIVDEFLSRMHSEKFGRKILRL